MHFPTEDSADAHTHTDTDTDTDSYTYTLAQIRTCRRVDRYAYATGDSADAHTHTHSDSYAYTLPGRDCPDPHLSPR